MEILSITKQTNMKTKEEIDKIYLQVCKDSGSKEIASEYCGFVKGYTQCQEDNKDKKYTLDDMKKACACGIDIACKEGENDFQPFEDLINSLNKDL